MSEANDQPEMLIGNEGDSDNSGTSRNRPHFTAFRKTRAASSGVGSEFAELVFSVGAGITCTVMMREIDFYRLFEPVFSSFSGSGLALID